MTWPRSVVVPRQERRSEFRIAGVLTAALAGRAVVPTALAAVISTTSPVAPVRTLAAVAAALAARAAVAVAAAFASRAAVTVAAAFA
ncbi:MAG TPA: hypothetical protein VGW34_01285, partial [Allosphingosinicella sp.]|nr:hypothetical protein [Allosphingosinicella sp.]